MTLSSLVGLIRAYGPSSSSEAKYDELVQNAVEKSGISPIEIASPLVDDLVENFRGTNPKNVILTGTAGDGKTWHARQVYTRLGGDADVWNDGGLVELQLPENRKLIVVKDLSQFHEDPRQRSIMEGLLASLKGRDAGSLYLVAANDGQFLRFWRTYLSSHPETDSILKAFSTMLKDGSSTHPKLYVLLHNLSQRPHDTMFDDVVEAIATHPGWDDCKTCELGADKCPIRRNRSVLTETEMRYRLRDMIKLAADNDMHLPMRHVFLLIANILLGVKKPKSVLLDCPTAKALVAHGEERLSNPYDNALGLNLREGEYRSYLAFLVLEKAGIGQETTSFIDRLLIEKLPEDAHRSYVANDPVHGADRFAEILSQYTRGTVDDFENFQAEIEAQRRRLFFVFPPSGGDDRFDPWKLSVFVFGGIYLRFAQDLIEQRPVEKIKRQLVRGINRSLSGMMCEDDNRVWFTSPVGNTQGRIGRVLDVDVPLGETKRDQIAFDFVATDHGRLRMAVKVWTGGLAGMEEVESNPLQPLLFEYLMRVNLGSLPGSFSRQCYEELRQFRLRVVAALTRLEYASAESVSDISLVDLDASGRLTRKPIGVVP